MGVALLCLGLLFCIGLLYYFITLVQCGFIVVIVYVCFPVYWWIVICVGCLLCLLAWYFGGLLTFLGAVTLIIFSILCFSFCVFFVITLNFRFGFTGGFGFVLWVLVTGRFWWVRDFGCFLSFAAVW